MKRVFVDMDGVLADFDKTWVSLFEELPRYNFNKHNWEMFVERGSFEALDLMPDARELIDRLEQVEKLPGVSVLILGSTGGYEMHGEVQEQKIRWLKTHGIQFKPIFVPGKRYKQWHATANSVLIDDHEGNIEQFISRNGRGILHTTAASSIEQLNKFL